MPALLNRISAVDQKSQYDASCKNVLASRSILALILKATAWEYRFMAIEDIKKCIEGHVSIGDTPVHPGEFISGMNSESSIYGEGTCYYDICFRSLLKDDQGISKIYFNIEAQNRNPPYPIEKRGMYYLGRMMSSQYETEFKGSHYEGIRKEYSIWICLNPEKRKRNTIIRYDMKPEFMEGNYELNKGDYDNISLVVINLGGRDEEGEGIIRMLKVLFSNRMSIDRKQRILEDEFKIKLSDEEKEDIEEMCNLSEGVEQRGIEIGLQRGKALGRSEGIDIGIQQGRSEGIDIGIQQGRSEGIDIGIQRGLVNTLTKLIRKIYRIEPGEWLERLTEEQLEKAEDIILDNMSYDEFINEVEK